MMEEIWKPIVGYETYGMVSNLGRVMSLDRVVVQKAKRGSSSTHLYKGKILTPIHQRNGYLVVTICKKVLSIHRLVCDAFIPNPCGKPCVNHKDGNKKNNSVENLEWCTYQENSQHAHRNGLIRTRTQAHIESARENVKKATVACLKQIDQYSVDGKFIKRYSSIAEAGRATGANISHITQCAKGNHKTCGGYVWRYV